MNKGLSTTQSVLLSGLLIVASGCVDEVEFELVVTMTVDLDELSEGAFPPGDFSVTEPGGVALPISVEQTVELANVSADADQIIADGGISEILDVRVAIPSNSSNTRLSDLRVAMASPANTDPFAAELTGVIPYVLAGSGSGVTYEWLPNGMAWVEHFIETRQFKVYLLGDLELSEGDLVPFGSVTIRVHWRIRAFSQ